MFSCVIDERCVLCLTDVTAPVAAARPSLCVHDMPWGAVGGGVRAEGSRDPCVCQEEIELLDRLFVYPLLKV